jgi:hypothetical protein
MLGYIEKIEILLTFLGIRNPFKKKQTFKRLLYCFYTLFIEFLIIKRIAIHSSNYSEYGISHILNLVDRIYVYVNYGGLFIVYLESFFSQRELGLIKKEFKEVDRILLDSFRSRIEHYGTIKIFITITSTLYTILISVNGILVTIGRSNLNVGIITTLSYFTSISFTFYFGLICYHMKKRLSLIPNFFACSSERINSSDYENAGKVLQKFSRIFKLTNKYFRIKFLYIVGKCQLFMSEKFFYKLVLFYFSKSLYWIFD